MLITTETYFPSVNANIFIISSSKVPHCNVTQTEIDQRLSNISKYKIKNIYYVRDDAIYESAYKLKNFELKSLINPDFKLAKKSLIDEGYVSIDISESEEKELDSLSRLILDKFHSGNDIKTLPLDDDFAIVKQLKKLILNIIGYELSLYESSGFEFNKMNGSYPHIDNGSNLVFVYTLQNPQQKPKPTTMFIPIKYNSNFYNNKNELNNLSIAMATIGSKINNKFQHVPLRKAILFLADRKFNDSAVNKLLEGKNLIHKGYDDIEKRNIITIRFEDL